MHYFTNKKILDFRKTFNRKFKKNFLFFCHICVCLTNKRAYIYCHVEEMDKYRKRQLNYT